MLSRYIASILFGAGAGGAATFYLFRRKQETTTETADLHHALKYGLPSSEGLRFFRNFVLSFDSRTRNPRWVLEHITRGQTQGQGNRKNVEFYEDKGLDQRFRSRLSDFKDSGYDRGHMAPAANHKESANTMLETFVLSNISPQVGRGFNRDYWARFERFVSLLTQTCDDVYVLTGPLFLPSKTPLGHFMQHPMIGQPPRMVAVPTHFFKVVLAERALASTGGEASTEAVMGAFVLPNAPLQADLPLTAFSVPLEALEEAAGLQFFPGFLNADRRAALDKAALAYQKWGRQQIALRGSSGPAIEYFALAQPPPDLAELDDAGAALLDTASSSSSNASSAAPSEPSQGRSGSMSGATDKKLPVAGESPLSDSCSSALDRDTAADTADSSQSIRKPRKQRSRSSRMSGMPSAADLGVIHVCDFIECKLPAEDWYLASKNRRT